MRRYRGRLLIGICVLCCLLMAACGKNKYVNSPYTGIWTAISAEYNGVELSQEDMGGVYVMTLEPDGTASMDSGVEVQSGKWEEVEGGIRLDKDDDLTLKDINGSLVLEMDGVTFTFAKQGTSAAETAPAPASETTPEAADSAAETVQEEDPAPAEEAAPAEETAPEGETDPEAGTAAEGEAE